MSVGIACWLEWLESGPVCAGGLTISFLSFLSCTQAVTQSCTTQKKKKKRIYFCEKFFRSFVNVGHNVRKVNQGFGWTVSFAKGVSYLDTMTLGIWQQ